jgi:hypothetical protein
MTIAAPIFGFDNRFDEATVTVGSNQALADALKDRNTGLAWESASTNADDTWIEATFAETVVLSLAGLFLVNLTTAAQYRLQAWSDAAKTSSVLDTGLQDVCPPDTPWPSRSWSRFNLWSGKPAEREWRRRRRKVIVPFSGPTQVRVVRFDLLDPANPDNLVRVARPFLGDAIQPAHQMDLGYERGLTPYFQAETAPSGARDVSETRPGLSVRGTLSWLSEGEFARFHDAFVLMGATGEVVWVPHPDDLSSIQRDAMLGTLVTPRPVRRIRNGEEPYSVNLAIEEWM